MFNQLYQDHIETLLQKIEEADAIIVGGASGLSNSAGYNWYQSSGVIWKNFSEFERAYEVRSLWEALYYRYSSSEERWGYFTKLIHYLYDSKPGQPYLDLYELIKDKDYFVVTTNQDFQFTKVFPEDKISLIQGDWRYFQCKSRCHDNVYYNEKSIREMHSKLAGTKIPSDLVPKCSECGGEMEPWIRSFIFLEGSFWKNQIKKYQTYLMKNKYKKVLFLELGVGTMTPMFIKEPFWEMTYSLPRAYYISINPKDAVVPREIEEKGLAINEDIARVFQDALNEKAIK
ncbi:hypothetical protein [Metabacillus rhizolycopersici]|uniref:NAD-dependent protein deacetylase, SIR2 family n=1 Tax=Metabacillus rhizolycopersici TaxID=2875709 RepID=A0ABS7UMR0_9BACI|nr:hypothetical protein [Metabacillus rhizolycopersici]MBZ5749593.1 hypothetical protein [Metabacillus rhizolycopersici]